MHQIKDLLFRGHELWLLSGKTMTQFSFLVFGGQIDTGSWFCPCVTVIIFMKCIVFIEFAFA